MCCQLRSTHLYHKVTFKKSLSFHSSEMYVDLKIPLMEWSSWTEDVVVCISFKQQV